MRVTFTEQRPGMPRDATMLTTVLADLHTASADIERVNLEPGAMRRVSFVNGASYMPVSGVHADTPTASAWPAAFGDAPLANRVSLSPFTLPAHARCRIRLGFDFINTIAAGVVTVPGIPLGKLAQWRIAYTLDAVPTHDDFSQRWHGGTAYTQWGSAFSEGWIVNDTDTDQAVSAVKNEVMEASGATIQSGYWRLQACIFRRTA